MSLFGLMPEHFNSLSNDEKVDKIEKILYMPFYFGLCVSKKGENVDYLKVAFDFEKLRQSMREEQVFRPNFAKLSRQKQPNEGSLAHFPLLRSRYLLSLAHERSEIAKMTHVEVSCDQNLHFRGV